MNANPYAAPQTIHSRFHVHELPMAQSRGNEDERRDFREFSTEQLTEFQEKSRTIDKAQFAWLFLIVAATILVLCGLSRTFMNLKDVLADSSYYPWYAVYAVFILRFCAGIDRRRWMRPLIVGLDSALFAACCYCLFNPACHQYLQKRHSIPYSTNYTYDFKDWYWCAIAVLVVLTYLVGKSAYAAFHAPELFSKHRYGHARLCQELDYRKEYGIE